MGNYGRETRTRNVTNEWIWSEDYSAITFALLLQDFFTDVPSHADPLLSSGSFRSKLIEPAIFGKLRRLVDCLNEDFGNAWISLCLMKLMVLVLNAWWKIVVFSRSKKTGEVQFSYLFSCLWKKHFRLLSCFTQVSGFQLVYDN